MVSVRCARRWQLRLRSGSCDLWLDLFLISQPFPILDVLQVTPSNAGHKIGGQHVGAAGAAEGGNVMGAQWHLCNRQEHKPGLHSSSRERRLVRVAFHAAWTAGLRHRFFAS